jgi:flagellar FliJ protein
MTKWAQSLIRISNYEVETLQKRLAEISTRRTTAEMRLAVLDAEREMETENARACASSASLLEAYLGGWKIRKSVAQSDLHTVEQEELGARDALMGAFEELKKFEHVAEATRLNQLVAAQRRDSAVMDEQAIRRAARAG